MHQTDRPLWVGIGIPFGYQASGFHHQHHVADHTAKAYKPQILLVPLPTWSPLRDACNPGPIGDNVRDIFPGKECPFKIDK